MSQHPYTISGTDVRRIVEGDLLSLWKEKLGLAEREDLTWKLPVQVGLALEPVALRFYGRESGRVVRDTLSIYGKDRVQHALFPQFVGTPDAFSDPADGAFAAVGRRLVEVKTTNTWTAKNMDKFIQKHLPQVTWYLDITGLRECDFVVLSDNSDLQTFTLGYDPEYAALLRDQADWFLDMLIARKEPPHDGEAAAAKAPIILAPKIVEVTGEHPVANAWADAAGRWLANRDAAKAFDQAVIDLKGDKKAKIPGLMPEDATEAHGFGITIKRSKSNALTISALA